MKTEPLLIEVPAVVPEEIMRGKHALNCYILYTWYEPHGYWKMWQQNWSLKAEVIQFINMDLPRGHTHAAIFHLTTK